MTVCKVCWGLAHHRAHPLCTGCGLPAEGSSAPAEPRVQVRSQGAVVAYKDRAKRRQWAKEGLCTTCGRERDIPGRVTCTRCKGIRQRCHTRKRDPNWKDQRLKANREQQPNQSSDQEA